jgi:hypothetical protein
MEGPREGDLALLPVPVRFLLRSLIQVSNLTWVPSFCCPMDLPSPTPAHQALPFLDLSLLPAF